MSNILAKIAWKKVGLFAGGVLFGTAGFKILGSDDAKKVYTHCTAAVLRCKDTVLEKKDVLSENASDIYAGAKDINEERAREKKEKEYKEALAKVEEAEGSEADQEKAEKTNDSEADAK